MERKVSFNPHQFLTDRVALSAVNFDMLEGAAADFSGGYFPAAASPFSIFPDRKKVPKYTNLDYLDRLKAFISGVSDVIVFYLLTEKPEIRERFIGAPPDNFKKLKNLANLSPRILLNKLQYDSDGMNNFLAQQFGFDFQKAADDVAQLTKTLREAKRGEITLAQEIIIRNGPKVLNKAKEIHGAINRLFEFANVESAAHYPEIAHKLGEAMDVITSDLQERIDKAPNKRAAQTGALNLQ